MVRPRIGIAGISIEASTFSPHRTRLGDFTVTRDDALLARYDWLTGERAAAPDTEPPLVVADVSRLRAVGWTDRYDLSTGLAETIEWWRHHEDRRA